MAHKTHDDVAARWVQRALHGQQSAPAYPSRNLHDEGRSIYSYGHHFEVGRILLDEKTKRPRGWLLNGDRWPGVVTTRHQGAVRSAVRNTGLPVVTLPHEVLAAAGIELDTVSVVDVQADWWTTAEIRKYEPVGKLERETRTEIGGWQNSLTGEYVDRVSYWGDDAVKQPSVECDHDIVAPGPWKPGWNWERDLVTKRMREIHERLHHGVWEEVPARRINTGRARRMFSSRTEWEIQDDPESPIGVAYVREIRRHWLGASLVRAAVITAVNAKCKSCDGTGLAAKPWHTYGGGHAEGPLTQEAIYRSESVHEHRMRRFRDGYLDEEPLFAWGIEFYAERTDCRACSGRGKTPTTRRRWAHFLSGFDENETRPSYFFCELPSQRSTTVEEAFEELKPEAVRFAEELGREVKRQGDIFAIPLPGLTLVELKQQGGEHLKYTSEMVTETVWGRRGTSREVRRRDSFHTAHVLGTNHEASEVVVFADGRTYGRGTLVHSPSGRLPDHRRVTLGKTWHLLVKNTVPIGA